MSIFIINAFKTALIDNIDGSLTTKIIILPV